MKCWTPLQNHSPQQGDGKTFEVRDWGLFPEQFPPQFYYENKTQLHSVHMVFSSSHPAAMKDTLVPLELCSGRLGLYQYAMLVPIKITI